MSVVVLPVVFPHFDMIAGKLNISDENQYRMDYIMNHSIPILNNFVKLNIFNCTLTAQQPFSVL